MITAMVATLLGFAIGIVLCVIFAWRGLVKALDKFNDRGR